VKLFLKTVLVRTVTIKQWCSQEYLECLEKNVCVTLLRKLGIVPFNRSFTLLKVKIVKETYHGFGKNFLKTVRTVIIEQRKALWERSNAVRTLT
jgi:hypothetical protein